MTMWENQVEKDHHSKPVPEVFNSGEGALPEAQLTPPIIFPDIPSDLPPAGHGEFLRKRRLLAKVLQQLQASGLPGQEQAQTFMLHLYRRNCRPNTLRAYSGAIQFFLTFLRHSGKVHLEATDLTRGRLLVHHGKGGKDQVVYIRPDTHRGLVEYLQFRPRAKAKQVFLVEKGPYTGKPLSVWGLQKRMEYYARKTGVTVSCHHLRDTMATQLLNADADLATIQDLLGHTWITTTQRYCKVSNLKVKRDYYKAMGVVMHRTLPE